MSRQTGDYGDVAFATTTDTHAAPAVLAQLAHFAAALRNPRPQARSLWCLSKCHPETTGTALFEEYC